MNDSISKDDLTTIEDLSQKLEAALFAAGEPLSVDRLMGLFNEGEEPGRREINLALENLQTVYAGRAIELKQVGSGYRFQVVPTLGEWVARLWQEKPARYSRALLETLAIIAYRQPVTRAEIEEIRGVSVSTAIMKTPLQREWVRSVGQRDVPGRPSVFATTRRFLDHFNISSLAELPPLDDIRDIADLTPELDFSDPSDHSDPMSDGPNDQPEVNSSGYGHEIERVVDSKEPELDQQVVHSSVGFSESFTEEVSEFSHLSSQAPLNSDGLDMKAARAALLDETPCQALESPPPEPPELNSTGAVSPVVISNQAGIELSSELDSDPNISNTGSDSTDGSD
ncbi:MAG: SMC-Scp complex subunit ScpB [Immundisolibacteraceae bacterium]|nr:SMC-Scp complex subunit ScpB [Immundisolibacteraceae bacterium]